MSFTTPVVRLRGPAALVAAVPYLIGFHPQESLVLVALQQRRVLLTLRVDLADADGSAAELAGRLQAAGADSVALLLYTEGDAAVHAETTATLGGLVADRLLDVLVVRAGRWRSLLCANPACCPPDGTPLESAPPPLAVAMAVQAGRQVLPDRAALVASVARVDEPAVTAALATARTGGGAGVGAGARKRARAALRRWSASGGRGELPAGDAADLLVALGEREWRDELLLASAKMADDTLLPLLQRLCRLAPDDLLGPAATLLAVAAYLRGDGSLANVALERALAADPGYAIALWLVAALDAQVPPEVLRRSLLTPDPPLSPDQTTSL